MSNLHNPIRKPRPTSRPAAPVPPFQPSGLRLGLLLLLLLTVMAPCARSQTPPGADTLATLIDSTICDSQLPFHWRSHTITYSMLRPDTARQNLFVSLTDTVGADSSLTLNLHINPTYHFHRYDEIFEGDTLFVHDTFRDDYKVLNAECRRLGYSIPPLVNAYMGLSPTMKTFGTAINDEFGDVEESGILITIADILQEKHQRYIDEFKG